MGWLSQIFKCFKSKTSKGSNQGNYKEDSEREKVDIEENKNGNNESDCNSQLEENEQLPRAMEEDLNLDSPPRHGNEYMYPPILTYFPTVSRICARCNTEIHYGEEYINCLSVVWHPECLLCRTCNLPIPKHEISICRSYPYHRSCSQDYLKCVVCKHDIPTNYSGAGKFMMHKLLTQTVCSTHIHDGTPICFSCLRMEPPDAGEYVDLNDGRQLCLECLDSAIMDTKACQPLYIETHKFYEGLHMKVDKRIPLLLVERQELHKIAKRSIKLGQSNVDVSLIRALCLFSEEETISTISRRPGFGTGNRALDIRTKHCNLTRQPCGVTAILILFGLPRMLTGSIIAHEMMHAWLRSFEGYRRQSDAVEEGICQFMAHMWLEAELSSASNKRPNFESKLGEVYKLQIEWNNNPVYGDGFRAAQKAVNKYGLQWTLVHIGKTGNFPL